MKKYKMDPELSKRMKTVPFSVKYPEATNHLIKLATVVVGGGAILAVLYEPSLGSNAVDAIRDASAFGFAGTTFYQASHFFYNMITESSRWNKLAQQLDNEKKSKRQRDTYFHEKKQQEQLPSGFTPIESLNPAFDTSDSGGRQRVFNKN